MELSRDKIKEIINDDWLLMDDCEGNKNCDVVKELARIALASLEAEPVGCDACGGNGSVDIDHGEMGIEHIECPKCYTAPPAPVSVPDAISTRQAIAKMENHEPCDSINVAYKFGWNACRAAMLQGSAGNSPVIPDGWKLVPKEPTAEMQSAAASAIRFDTTPINKLWTGNAAYKAMLAAAPQQEVR